jgi:hypothetical protein
LTLPVTITGLPVKTIGLPVTITGLPVTITSREVEDDEEDVSKLPFGTDYSQR